MLRASKRASFISVPLAWWAVATLLIRARFDLRCAKAKKPNTYLFAGDQCWDRAIRRRIQFGLGCALVLPADCEPEDLIWPPLRALIVAWPDYSRSARVLKLRLVQALVRDGVRYAAVEHAPEWLLARPAGAQPDD